MREDLCTLRRLTNCPARQRSDRNRWRRGHVASPVPHRFDSARWLPCREVLVLNVMSGSSPSRCDYSVKLFVNRRTVVAISEPDETQEPLQWPNCTENMQQ